MKEEQMDLLTPEHVSLRFSLAGLGSRSAAQIIDSFIPIIINSSLAYTYMLTIEENFSETTSNYFLAIIFITIFFLFWGYFVLFEFLAAGRTPGKMIIGLRVIQENGQSVTLLSSLLRNLLRIIDLLPLFYLLGMIMIFFQAKHQRIGDLVAGTVVILEIRRKEKRVKARVEKELDQKNVQLSRIILDEWSKKRIGLREWNLLKTYVNRRQALSIQERERLTIQVAKILLPLIGGEIGNRIFTELEKDLLVLYLLLREEWEFEL